MKGFILFLLSLIKSYIILYVFVIYLYLDIQYICIASLFFIYILQILEI